MGAHPDLCDRCGRTYGEHTIFELGACRRPEVEGGPERRFFDDDWDSTEQRLKRATPVWPRR